MKETLIRIIREAAFRSCSLVAGVLPLWKETKAVVVLPAMLSFPVALPVNYDMLPEAFAKQFVKTKRIPSRRIFVFKNVWVSGRAVVFKNLSIFTPSLPWLRDIPLYRKGKLLMKQWARNVQHIPASVTVALAYDNWAAENYYHWMVESLPRLLLVKKKYPDAVLLIPDPAPEYVSTSVALLGFDKVLPLKRKDDTVLKVGRLVLPELVYYEEEEYGDLSRYKREKAAEGKVFPVIPVPLSSPGEEELIVAVRKKLLKHFTRKAAPPVRRVFVSRSRQKTRRLINEQEVLPVLERYGFETICFEDLTFQEQVQLMLETAFFVSVHGSNMVNILFLQTGAKVVEMMNSALLNDAYYLMSSSIGLPYYSVHCAMADKQINLRDDSVKLNDADLLVNVPELEETLVLALQQPVVINSKYDF